MKSYRFSCPVCRKVYRTDAGPQEPCCTGPSEMRDDHPMALMRLVGVDRWSLHPDVSEQRARMPLILPN